MPVETLHRVDSRFETLYQRDYSIHEPDMRSLYEKAKCDQWNASRDINWETPLDLDKGIFADELIDGYGSDALAHLDAKTLARLNVEFSCWRISQLLHGEEGAMLACSQLVDMVPGNDAKFFQSTQVVDEARHTEVLSRYLIDKCGGKIYPVTPNLQKLFDFILGQGKWFIKTVGLQLIAETFAVALFRLLGETAKDPILSQICKRILADESRHMGFSILSLPDEIRSLSPSDLREVEDFTRDAINLVLGGQFPQEAYETIGMNAAEIQKVKKVRKEAAVAGNDQTMFRKLFKREMHTTVVTNIKKVGLLNERTSGFLRDIGIDPTLGQTAAS